MMIRTEKMIKKKNLYIQIILSSAFFYSEDDD